MFGSFTIESLDRTEEFPLAQARVEIGRGPDNDLTLPFPTVSTRHARVLCDSSACRILDLGSANGTAVNGEELPVREERRLRDGDDVRIGPFTLVFHTAPAEGRAAPAARPGHTVVLPPTRPPRLRVTTPEGSQELPLPAGTLTLGRDPACDIVASAEAVSRRHASLERRGDKLLVRDLGSTNGISVDGVLVPEKLLGDGGQVAIGKSVTLTFLAAEDVAAEAPGYAGWAAGAEPQAQVYDIGEGQSLQLGRGAETVVHLAHPQVSQLHAEVSRQQGQVVIRDKGSSAGTFVNGQQVVERVLHEGDVVRIGPNQLVIRDGRLQLMSEEGRLRLDAFHLGKTVGKEKKKILRDISLSIRPQEFVAVVGGSGAGKSTLVTALCGFKPATEGAVLLNGADLYRNFDAYRNEMGYVPQDDIIHLDLSVRKALDYAARLRLPADTTEAERRQRVADVIDELDLKSAADTTIRSLSGGQRKRASIGVELLTRPSLFFLDEATSGLDPATESQMMKLLRKLADQGRTIILITHATKNVMVCDKVCFLARGGYLAFFGPPEDALAYFGVKDFDEIYERIEAGATPEEWAARYLRSRECQDNVVTPLTEVAKAWTQPGGATGGGDGRGTAAPLAAAPGAKVRATSGWDQFLILSSRYLRIVMSDKKTLILLLAISPVLCMIDFITWKNDLFDPVTGSASKAVTMLFMACIIGVLVGTITSVREIVKEDAIYRRERMVCVKVFPYVMSKIAVGSIFALYSAVVLWGFKMLAVDFSHLSLTGYLSLLFTFVLVTFAGLMWGLLVSAVAPTEDRAMLLVILVLVPQFMFAGGMLPMADLGFFGKAMGAVTSTRWGLGALATIAEVKTGAGEAADMSDVSMPGLQGLGSVGEKVALVRSLDTQYGAIFNVNVGFYWLMSLVLILGLVGIIFVLQKRKDTL